MLRPWHKEDVFNALKQRGWHPPVPVPYPDDWYYVGEAWVTHRANQRLHLYFVADFGTGFKGADGVESVIGQLAGDPLEYDLWLSRTRGAHWKSSLPDWASRVSKLQNEPTPGMH